MLVSKWPLMALGVCSALVGGCSSDVSDGSDQPGGSCNARVGSFTGLSAVHVAECSALDYAENPPAGGDHYPVWAAFQSYAFAVPRGYWVHDLEHGAVVFSYNCPDGCSAEVAAVQSLIDSLPTDPRCTGQGTLRRVVLTPDPLLDTRWGVSAWGHTLTADCVDSERFRRFYTNHSGQGPEDLCAPGSDFDGVAPCE